MFNDLYIGEVPARFKRAKSVRRAIDDAYCGGAQKCEAVAAIASIVGGGAALVAGVEGFAALAAVGAIVGGVGALTGDSSLTKIGAVMGIAGGIGSLGASQGWWGDIGANATSAVGEGGNIQNLVNSETAGIQSPASAVPAAAESAASDAIASGVEPSAAALSDSGSIGESLAQSTNANVSDAIGKSSGLMDANYPITDTGTMSVPGVDSVARTATNVGLGDGIGMATQAPTFWDRFSSAAENVSTWMDKHKVASEAVLRGVGGLADTYGTKGGLTDAQRRFYEARIKSENAALANANYGGPDITKQFALKPGTTPYVGTGIMFSGKK